MAFTKMLWVDSTSVIGSWNYWKSVSGNLFTIHGTRYSCNKTNNKIAYYAYIRYTDDRYSPLIISPDVDAVAFSFYWYGSGTSYYSSQGSFVDDNGITWYYGCFPQYASCPWGDVDSDTGVEMYDTAYTRDSAGNEQAAKDLLDRVYSVPFHEDYQVNQTYTPYYCDKLKTIRKVVGIFLFKNVVTWGTDAGYISFSDNVDTIISTIMAYENPKQWNLIQVRLDTYYIVFQSLSASFILSQMTINSESTDYGFKHYGYSSGSAIQFIGRRASISRSNGAISYDTTSSSSTLHDLGIYETSSRSVISETVGMDL